MEERSEPQRVEVELTAAPDGTRRGRRGRRRDEVAPTSPPSAPGPADPPVDTRPPGERTGEADESRVVMSGGSSGPPRRTLVIGLAAGAVGVLLGWILGGTSGSTEQATTATSGPTATAGSVATEEALEPIDTVRATTTTRPRRTTTTTTVAPAEMTQVALNSLIAGADFRIVGIAGNSRTAEIDVASGEMTTQDWGIGTLEPFATHIGDDWVVTTNFNSGRLRVLTVDGEQASVNLGDAWSLLRVAGTDRFWRGSGSPSIAGTFDEFEEVTITGEATGATISTRGHSVMAPDPAGGILTVAQGSTYSLREDGVVFVGAGELMAVSADHAVVRGCDELLECQVFVVDRATGEQRVVPFEPDVVSGSHFGFGPPFIGTVSPDGGAIGLITPTNSGLDLAAVDLVTGAAVELTSGGAGFSSVSWTPDGRFGLFVDSVVPKLYDRETGSIEPLGDDLGSWSSVEVRSPTE